jgi:hypothetical protein
MSLFWEHFLCGYSKGAIGIVDMPMQIDKPMYMSTHADLDL